MTFFDYLDKQYTNKNTQLQKEYSQKLKAETTAIHELLQTQRNWFKFWGKVSLIFDYLYCSIFQKWPTQIEFKPTLVQSDDVGEKANI